MSDAHRAQWRREIAPDSAWGSDTPRRIVDLAAAVAVAAALIDAVLTWFLLDGSIHLERNPVIEAAMHAFGIAPTLTIGAILRLGIVFAIAAIATRAVRPAVRYAAATTLGVVTIWWCAVVFANAAVVARPWLAR